MTYEYAVGAIYMKDGHESLPMSLRRADTLEEARAQAAAWNAEHEEWNRQELVREGILPGADRRYVVLFRQVPSWSIAADTVSTPSKERT